MYEVFWLLFIGLFGLLWNIFAVIGLVVSINWFYQKTKKTNKPSNERVINVGSQVTLSVEKGLSEENVKLPKEKVTESTFDSDLSAKTATKNVKTTKTPTKPTTIDPTNTLLYTGALLVAFAIFIFVAFNWQTYTDGVKTLIILIILASMYALAYLFSLKKAFKQVSATFLMLASLALGFTGVGLWKFMLEGSILLTIEDFWFMYSILLTAVYMITFIETRRKVYFFFTLLTSYMVLLYAAPALISNEIYRIAFILILHIPIYLALRQFNKIFYPESKITEIVGHLVNFFYGIANMVFAYSVLFRLNSSLEIAIIVSSLFIPTLFVFIAKKVKRFNFPINIESFLFPIKAILAWRLISLTPTSYDYLSISLVIFAVTYLISNSKLFKKKLVKDIVFPALGTSFILSLTYAWVEPVQTQSINMLVVSGTYALLSIALHYKLIRSGRHWFRLLNIPLDLIVFVALMIGLEQHYDISIAEPQIIGMVMIIPATLHLMSWMVRASEKFKPEIIYSIVFLVIGTLLTIGEPQFLAVISAIGVMHFLITTLASKKAGYIVGSYLFSVIIVTAFASIYDWYASSAMAVLVAILIVVGSLWRLKSFTSKDDVYNKIAIHLQTIAKVMGVGLMFLAFTTVFESHDSVIYLFLLLTGLALTVDKIQDSYRYLSGVGLVYTFWHLLQLSDTPIEANSQLYAFPLVTYALTLSYLLYEKRRTLSKIFMIFAYSLPMGIALIQSITSIDPYSLYHGLILITVSSALVIVGSYKKDKIMLVISSAYLIVELIIRLWDVIISIPWWVYIGGFGMTLIGLAVRAIYKLSQKSTPDSTK